MLDYTQLETLAHVLRLGSFEAAAAQMHVTQSAVSQRIKHLEDRVGTPLVMRGHPCTGTEMGLRLARHAEDVALLEHQLDTQRSGPDPVLRIAVNADSLATWVLPAFAKQDAVFFDLLVDDQDHSAEWLKRGAVSAAITATPNPPQGCDSTALGNLEYIPTAAPEFAQKHFAQGYTQAGFDAAPMIVFNNKDRLQHNWLKEEYNVVPKGPSHVMPSTQAFIEAAVLGIGWGMNPEPLVREHLASGRLVSLSERGPYQTPLYWQSSRLMAPALTGVKVAVLAAAAKVLK